MQQVFLASFLFQFVLEIFVYETMESAIVSYGIPSLAYGEIQIIKIELKNLAKSMHTKAPSALDVPQYLFVSK